MGYLVSIEGGEFTGKSSVAAPALHAVLQRAGYPALVSREPGGTLAGEEIRTKIFQSVQRGASPLQLAELFNESRRIHLNEIIHPFFEQHADGVVILDRFADSTLVYQGLEGGSAIEDLLALHSQYSQNVFPDLTLILHFPEDRFARTMRLRNIAEALQKRDATAWDTSSDSIHTQRQAYYLSLPDLYAQHGIPRTFAAVDASRHPYDTIEGVVKATADNLPALNPEGRLLKTYHTLREQGEWEHLHEHWRVLRELDPELRIDYLPQRRR